MTAERVTSVIDGAFAMPLTPFDDHRGKFVKLLDASARDAIGGDPIVDAYVARSTRGVLRGFHLQLPPCAHSKLVTCLEGEVLDVALDVRPDSPTRGMFASFELRAIEPLLVCLAPGLAHAYYVRSDEALVLNMATSGYCAEHEQGWRWDSVPAWPDNSPILSDKDRRWALFS